MADRDDASREDPAPDVPATDGADDVGANDAPYGDPGGRDGHVEGSSDRLSTAWSRPPPEADPVEAPSTVQGSQAARTRTDPDRSELHDARSPTGSTEFSGADLSGSDLSGPELDGSDGSGSGGSGSGGSATWPAADHRSRHRGSRKRPEAKGGSFLRELPVLLLVAFVLAFLLRTFVLQVFYIPSSSMEPTLQIDDRMVVEKLTYLVREPRRGEIVVFEGEAFIDPYADQGAVARTIRGVGQFLGVVPASARDFVKRVIGVGGDEVVIESGQVFVNGEPLDEPYVVFEDGADYGPVTVPDDHLFFLGDNRPNSSDSRRSLGFVARDHVVGRAAVIIWPLDHAGRLTGVDHEVPEPAGAREDPSPSDADGGDEQATHTDPLPTATGIIAVPRWAVAGS